MQALNQGWQAGCSLHGNRGGCRPQKAVFATTKTPVRKVRLPTELRQANSLHGVGASLLTAIIRRGYTRAFPRLVRIGFANY